ncbi:response regulator receiver protein [Candidatus Magnetoovum chiemensis]|nr:response regulator receiver protein [Candidatus Magnetoovum chiemensis]
MKKILVIEDNQDSMDLVEAILESAYEVIKTSDSRESLRLAIKHKPDLIILDISMPYMDGPEVLEKIKESHVLKYTPVIALTAHAMAGDRENYLAKGFDGYVSKHIVDESILIDAVERLLAGR